MGRFWMLSALAAAVVLTQPPVPSRAATADLASARQAIAAGNARYIDRLVKADPVGFASLYTTDGVQMPSSGRAQVRGRAAIQKSTEADLKDARFTAGFAKTTNLAVSGNEAYETGTYRFNYVENKKPGVLNGRYFVVWERQDDGSYLIKVDSSYPAVCPK